MSYHVRLIENDQLPAEHSWAMVRDHGDYIFLVKPAGLTPRSLERAWSAYRMLNRQSVGAGH